MEAFLGDLSSPSPRCRDETFFDRDSVEGAAETSSLSCGNFGFDRPNVGLNEGFFQWLVISTSIGIR
jgi:hypothetical protein